MIEARNLTKFYDGQPAVDRLSLTISPGEIFCLLGPNGAGKTTTINLFLHFTKPDAGTALINGIDVQKEPIHSKQYLAYIPENLQLYPNLTGLENLDYFSALAGKRYDRKALEELLTEAGLHPEAFARRVRNYSKGMRQKVGIAIALAKKAKALLLDEPTSGLDPRAGNEFARLIRRLGEQGVAILMATHDLFRAKETGTQIGIMQEGRLTETMPAANVSHTDLEKKYLELVPVL